MNISEITEICSGKENILTNYDIICDFFSGNLPNTTDEIDDLSSTIMVIRDVLENANQFEKLMKFLEIVRNKHPLLYAESFAYLDDFLIDYYCFHNEVVKVDNSFSNFINSPVKYYDILLIVLKKYLFYQYPKTIDYTIVSIYETIDNSDKLWGDPIHPLSEMKLFIQLDEFYCKFIETQMFDKLAFAKLLVHYHYTIPEDYLTEIENCFIYSTHNSESLVNKFTQHRADFFRNIELLFLKEMKQKNFPFVLSSFLFEEISVVCSAKTRTKNQTLDDYFSIKTKQFDDYLNAVTSDFIDNTHEKIAILWGSVYVYDFLLSTELINIETYNGFKETSKILKGKFIARHSYDLWKSNFVHQWQKPDSISETEFVEEEKIFRRSYEISKFNHSILQEELSNGLYNIGELKDYFITACKENNKYSKPFFNDTLPKTTQPKKTRKKKDKVQ